MDGRSITTVLVTLLAAAGVYINYQLTLKHVTPADASPDVPEWFDAVCNPEGSETFSCDEALKSRWAYFSVSDFSFKTPSPQSRKELIFPVSLLGMFYFSILFVWYLGVGECSYNRRFWHLVPLMIVLCGAAASAYFAYVMVTQLEAKCPWCIAAHAINGLLLIGTILLWPRRPRAVAEPAAQPDEAVDSVEPATQPAVSVDLETNPHGRLVLITALCAVTLLYAQTLLYGHQKFAQVKKAYEEEITRMQGDTETQLLQHFGYPIQKVDVRPDDPARGGGRGISLVLFSDFQCPACRRAAKSLEERVLPQFEGRIRLVWKHYPLCADCNPNVSRNLHPQACAAAYAAEAARLQGGVEKFWQLHDYLFANQTQIRQMNYRQVAKQLLLDPDKFVADMESDAVKQRVQEDIALGKSLNIKSTPSMYLGGRPLPTYMFYNPSFMDSVKKAVEQNIARQKKHAAAQKAKQEASGGESSKP